MCMLHNALAVQRGDRGVERCVESEWTIVGNGLSLVTLLGDISATNCWQWFPRSMFQNTAQNMLMKRQH
jgi:hypothetical protein